MLPTLYDIVRALVLTGPLLSHMICDKFQHVPIELGDEAVITSEGYPLTQYKPFTKCMTSFYPATSETRVQVDCPDLETDGSSMDIVSRLFVGDSDYLLLANGLTWTKIRSPLGGSVRRVGEPGQVVRVGFFTDVIGRARGFSCTVRGVRSETGLPCGERQLPLISRRRKARILGGTTQDENQWPWMVQVFSTLARGPAVCSGSLITPRDVLTSAHCMPTDGSPVTVVAGALELGAGVPLTSTDYTRHPDYDDTDPLSLNDIAVIRLPFPQTYSAAVRPVCLPRLGDPDPTRATTAGWGQRMAGEEPSDLLQAVTISLNCSQTPAGFSATGQVLCTIPSVTGATPCPSDSGGALMAEDDGVFTQVGITYLGVDCSAASDGALFTRVQSFLTFIEDNTDWRQP